MHYNLITILGPTATGKTSLAANVAYKLDGEIISGDSRQVYRGMNLGTGKDYDDYLVNGYKVPYHLIDIVDAGYKYNIFEFQNDFFKVFNEINSRGKLPVLCGGSGLYIESVIDGYKLISVPVNEDLHKELDLKSTEELIAIYSSYQKLHNQTDINERKRLIRAIEIAKFSADNPDKQSVFPEINTLLVGIHFDVEVRRNRITQRLKQRIASGMIDEVNQLLNSGVPAETLVYYGLEYKFITNYILGKLTFADMVEQLNVAIHQFAKRQMTWFRRMERNGKKIVWLDGNESSEARVKKVIELFLQSTN